jgi:hypothetical protein
MKVLCCSQKVKEQKANIIIGGNIGKNKNTLTKMLQVII